MGKKNKNDKKGKGKEKTALKTEKKAERKAKKELAKKGEDDIESLIAEFQAKDRQNTQVTVEKCNPPTERSNMTLNAHPDKEELIMFGGEFYTGSKMFMYNDLYFYNIKKNEWSKVTAPNPPPPRSSHQAVTLKQGGGQLWIFGGEFASPTQSQFYHYKELWLYHIKHRQWEKISAAGAPSSRSGHRMVHCKKLLIVFGGFHDNIRDYKYFNDVHIFNMETYTWTKLDVGGSVPSPRSGCIMVSPPDQYRVVVYGGYSKEKVKRDVDKGTVHSDMYVLMPEGRHKDDSVPEKWKWQAVRPSGDRPSPRSGMTAVVTHDNRAVCFGGVFDNEDGDEELEGQFYNDMYLLDLERHRWFPISLRGRKGVTEKKKRRRKKEEGGEEGEEMEEEDDGKEEMEEDMKTLDINSQDVEMTEESAESANNTNNEEATDNTYDDGIFKVSVSANSAETTDGDVVDRDASVSAFVPKPRMGAQLVIKSSVLYLYGGMWENGDKQYTLKDFYSLDLDKMDEWNTILQLDEKDMMWEDSGSSDEEMEAAGGADEEEEEDEDSEDDIETLLEGCDVPARLEEEEVTVYFERTKAFWVEQSKKYFESENMSVSNRTLQKFGREMCQEYCDKMS
ncbi:hypothetical protein FSP39_015405 [Pinctada imbricata]|uniref:Kelch domain-containing protein 4 n=1 Tax=Pinctada imbricata TaxID=66713 RepID=A0AA89BXF2_PINIB|nr:hypothetical protein FSP39_015405 [Pinctada imbricata]